MRQGYLTQILESAHLVSAALGLGREQIGQFDFGPGNNPNSLPEHMKEEGDFGRAKGSRACPPHTHIPARAPTDAWARGYRTALKKKKNLTLVHRLVDRSAVLSNVLPIRSGFQTAKSGKLYVFQFV